MQKNKKIQFVLPIIRENKSTKKMKIKKPNRLYTKPSQIYIHTYHKKQKSKPKFEREIEYLMTNSNSANITSKEIFSLRPTESIDPSHSYIKKYHPAQLNRLMNIVLSDSPVPKEEIYSSDYKTINGNRTKKNDQFQTKRENRLFQKILQNGEDRNNQIIFDNLLKFKYLETKYMNILAESYNNLDYIQMSSNL